MVGQLENFFTPSRRSGSSNTFLELNFTSASCRQHQRPSLLVHVPRPQHCCSAGNLARATTQAVGNENLSQIPGCSQICVNMSCIARGVRHHCSSSRSCLNISGLLGATPKQSLGGNGGAPYAFIRATTRPLKPHMGWSGKPCSIMPPSHTPLHLRTAWPIENSKTHTAACR